MFTGDSDGGEDVFHVARDDYSDGDLAVVRGVHRVESAATGVEADFAAQMAAQGGVERIGVHRGGFGGAG